MPLNTEYSSSFIGSLLLFPFFRPTRHDTVRRGAARQGTSRRDGKKDRTRRVVQESFTIRCATFNSGHAHHRRWKTDVASGYDIGYLLLNSIREPPTASGNYVPADVIAFIADQLQREHILTRSPSLFADTVRDKKQRAN